MESAGYSTKPLLAAPMVTSVSLFIAVQSATILIVVGGIVLKKVEANAHEKPGGTRAEGACSGITIQLYVILSVYLFDVKKFFKSSILGS